VCRAGNYGVEKKKAGLGGQIATVLNKGFPNGQNPRLGQPSKIGAEGNDCQGRGKYDEQGHALTLA